jgi:heterodisulfide reductase subunit A
LSGSKKKVLVMGGGVAGLSSALELSKTGYIDVEILEKSSFLGGHAIQFACKATDRCVSCGACMVEEKLKQTVENPNIHIYIRSRIRKITKSEKFSIDIIIKPEFIDSKMCTGCGVCLDMCPFEGSVMRGFSKNNMPLYTICEDSCLYFKNKSCAKCQELCPEDAINLDALESCHTSEVDAIIAATGFQPYNPVSKPYGYGLFDNVITNLELERTLRENSAAARPSDGKAPRNIAFIQCVGSRDAGLNHLWCSKVCCASALRMANLIKMRQPDTEITFFYIDVQTFGKNFQAFYDEIQKNMRQIRAIPGDIYPTRDDRLQLTYFDGTASQSVDEIFDLVVLSIGLIPGQDNPDLAGLLNLEILETGFLSPVENGTSGICDGIFTAGTVQGPMSIPETIAHATGVSWEAIKYLSEKDIQ